MTTTANPTSDSRTLMALLGPEVLAESRPFSDPEPHALDSYLTRRGLPPLADIDDVRLALTLGVPFGVAGDIRDLFEAAR